MLSLNNLNYYKDKISKKIDEILMSASTVDINNFFSSKHHYLFKIRPFNTSEYEPFAYLRGVRMYKENDATHAVNTDSATNDSKGQNIAGTYIKGFSVSGQTVTYTRGDGTTGKFSTQDNNTTYSAGSNLSLSGTQFNVSSAPTFNSVKVTNNSSNDILFGNYRVYVG